jgi:UDP-N-acetylglucosamine--N-acetylmuramyl-(pentapeptide) pyrophosphoryl-undecaprenol N-acetylglucosamine transferase
MRNGFNKLERRVIFAAGGTAGHVEPALAVARWLRKEDPTIAIIFIGTASGVENSLVPQAGFELKLITKAAFPRVLNINTVLWPARFLQSFIQIRKIVSSSRLVIGFGGYVCAPTYLAAKFVGVEIFAHEANAKPGMANKLGARLGATTLMALDLVGSAEAGSLASSQVVGTPLRSEITHLARLTPSERVAARGAALTALGLDPARATLLVFGGSLGSAKFNAVIEDGIDAILATGVQVIHALGSKNAQPISRTGYLPLPYISDMAQAYAAADCVISRSGAVSVTETGVLGLYAIYVPLDIGNGEQRLNAQVVVNQGGGTIVANSEFSTELLLRSLPEWLAAARAYRESGRKVDFPLDAAMRIGVKILAALRLSEKRSGGRRG